VCVLLVDALLRVFTRTIPALPVRDVPAAVAHYRQHFGFETPHETADFAVLVRDDAVLHLWGATDVEWRSREKLTERPVCSGAESFLAGTASCRIEVADVDALFVELEPEGVLHDVAYRPVVGLSVRAGITRRAPRSPLQSDGSCQPSPVSLRSMCSIQVGSMPFSRESNAPGTEDDA